MKKLEGSDTVLWDFRLEFFVCIEYAQVEAKTKLEPRKKIILP